MMRPYNEVTPYEGIGILNDPVHGYIRYTKHRPHFVSEVTEEDILDHPWVQRLRFIAQLQSARWIYPAAEHTRFQHSIGAMEIASRLAQRIYPSLKKHVHDVPSFHLVESLLRMTALLHDVGHGPFSHFFDENFLTKHGLTHEKVSAAIILQELGNLLKELRRTPSGPFAEGERLEPSWVAFLVQKGKADLVVPEWVRALAPVFGGIYTADNMDYVQRDSYMCGIRVGPVDTDRLLYYTFFTEKGLTLHKSGLQALYMFLSARIYLYQNVYYHHKVRALDLQMRKIFPETLEYLLLPSPIKEPESYLELNDWSFSQTLLNWRFSKQKQKQHLGREWEKIFRREIEWYPVYEATFNLNTLHHFEKMSVDVDELRKKIRERVPAHLRKIEFEIDLAWKDARPLNPLQMGVQQIFIYDPHRKDVDAEPLTHLFEWIPARVVQIRVFTKGLISEQEFHSACHDVFSHLDLPPFV